MKKTKVLFRKMRRTGEIFALFVEIPANKAWFADCLCYRQKEGFTPISADIDSYTTSASRRDSGHIIADLVSKGFDLDFANRINNEDLTKRKKAFEEGKIGYDQHFKTNCA